MIEINNTVSKLLSNTKESNYTILTFIDTNLEIIGESLPIFIQKIIDKFPILKQYIIFKNSNIFLEDDSDFNIENHYTIVHDKDSNFDSHIDILLNQPFQTKSKWYFYYSIDKDAKKNRLFFKIDHAYADGYKIIEMLTTPIKRIGIENIFKHRNCSYFESFYYIIIGSIILLYNNLKLFIELLFLPKNDYRKSIQTDYIKCKPLKLSIIKEFVKKHTITVNDFLMSLMIKTDYTYTNVTRNIVSVSPINISGSANFNNMAPVFNAIINNLDNTLLFKSVHETFNCYKYSLYIPFITFILNNITTVLPLNILYTVHDKILQRCDYVYSNIIGPTIENINNIHFLTLAKDKEIVFNIISSGENINIICSFKEGTIKDKEHFEKCIYEAYDSLMKTI